MLRAMLLHGFILKMRKPFPREARSDDDEITRKFHEKGFVRFNLEKERIDEILACTKGIRSKIQEQHRKIDRKRTGDDTAINIEPEQCPEIYEILGGAVTDEFLTVLDRIMPGYFVDQVTYHFNVAEDYESWSYGDPDETVHSNSSWHVDTTVNSVKAMLYLNDVPKSENGAFNYVEGSHKLNKDWFDRAVMRAHGRHKIWFLDEASRSRFSKLPAFLQKKNQFGNDLAPGDKQWEPLRSGVRELGGPKGTLVLFDTNGIHRGGLVRAGVREALQIRFRNGRYV